MKICFIDFEGYMTWGGAGIFISNVSKELANIGNDIHILTITSKKVDVGVKYINGCTYHIHYYSIFRGQSKVLLLKRCLERLQLYNDYYSVIKKISPEIIYLASGTTGEIGYIANQFQHIPYCLGFHHQPGLYATTPISKIIERSQKILPFISKAAACITVNPHLIKPIQENFGVTPLVIPNGLDLNAFFPLPKKIRHNNAPIILTVTRLVHDKGLDDLIIAFADVLKSFPAAKLQIVGDGPLREQLENLVYTLNLEKSVVFVGYVPNNEVVVYYHNADLYVLPSWNESFSLVTFEAMGCGLPIVATNVGNLVDVIREENGILVPVNSSLKLADAICNILSLSDEEYIKKSESNIAVVQNYGWDKVAKRYYDLFASIVSANSLKSC